MKRICLLGATGSIGTQTLDVISRHPEQFSLEAISIGTNVELGMEIIEKYAPKTVCVLTKEDKDRLLSALSHPPRIVYGSEGLIEIATEPNTNYVVNAVIGRVGLEPTLAAIAAKKTVALANKETLVTAGHLVMEQARKEQVPILPIDSEHSAIFQCLNGENAKRLSRIILTASGGSFRDKTREELVDVTVAEALAHPNWSMGSKITIDSATMMNKGLEVIEAHWLFNLEYDKIDVVLHKESIIHSMVEFSDTSIIAQLGNPDMRVPIQYALSYPERLELSSTKRLNLEEIGTLHFQQIDFDRYKCLQLAYNAGRIGGTMPTVLNAANEVAVALFLDGAIPFLAIEELVEKALEAHRVLNNPDLETIQAIDEETRAYVLSLQK